MYSRNETKETALTVRGLSKAPSDLERPTTQVVFIISSGHSGSTLLSMILGAHPNIVAVSEISWFNQWVVSNRLCSCGLAVKSCPLWSAVLARIVSRRAIDIQNFSNEFPIDLSTAFDRSRPGERVKHLLSIMGIRFMPVALWQKLRKLRVFAEAARRAGNAFELFDSLREVSGRSILVDSSKSVYRLLHLYLLRPDSVRAIYLTRDGRAVTNSLMKHNRYPAKTAALRWWYGNIYSRWMLNRLPRSRCIHVRYEELCHDTENTMRRLCEFLGIEHDSSILNFHLAEQHLIAGNGMRFRREAGITEDRSWLTQLSQESLRTFEEIGGRLNRKLLGVYCRNHAEKPFSTSFS
jgi:Sulfotransferase family